MRMHTGAQNGGKYTRNSYHIGQMPAAIDCGSRESVFNLNQHLWELQTPSLEDYISTSVMLQYNKRFFCNKRFFSLRE